MFDDLLKLFDLLSRSTTAISLTAIGFILLVAGMLGLSKIVTLKPEDTSLWLKRVTAICFVFGVVFATAGPAIALLNIKANPIDRHSQKEAWARLKENSEVKWLIRLIAYDPEKEGNLSIGQLKKLGPDWVEYTFVAVYDELKGYTVKDALNMIGAITPPADYRVSAIIFPVSIDIIPANSRGLLQVIQELEANHPEFTNKIVNTNILDQKKIDELKKTFDASIGAWSFSSVQPDYTKFCKITHNARCARKADKPNEHSVDALNLISTVNMDWHPVGGAIINNQKLNPCDTPEKYCDIDNWNDIEKDIEKNGNRFGARIFLIKNVELESLRNRYLIDFGNPAQLIPEIGAE